MPKKIISNIMLCLIVFSFVGCANQKTDENPYFFNTESAYHIGFKCESGETNAKIFWDLDGALHLLHENSNSPLFGMEEIFTNDGVKSHFHDMEFQNIPYTAGVWSVYRAVCTIQNEKAVSKEKNGKNTVYNYQQDGLEFAFSFSEHDLSPIEIVGKDRGLEFVIKFAEQA